MNGGWERWSVALPSLVALIDGIGKAFPLGARSSNFARGPAIPLKSVSRVTRPSRGSMSQALPFGTRHSSLGSLANRSSAPHHSPWVQVPHKIVRPSVTHDPPEAYAEPESSAPFLRSPVRFLKRWHARWHALFPAAQWTSTKKAQAAIGLPGWEHIIDGVGVSTARTCRLEIPDQFPPEGLEACSQRLRRLRQHRERPFKRGWSSP